ncbi:small, acid-soluble spore protein, alpha/beta type [Gorillibacterium sp. sgz500922]|uniref:small, acid-soluble spore protein, alpha/beta type n=1 Tax=Gorillibacterium sp. sgz500922 TaxID=3446694 RepID=UPI003F6643F7
MARSNQKVVPASKQALDAMKYEIAAELGLPVGQGYMNGAADTEFAGELGSSGTSGMKKDYWGHLASRDNGAVGGHITKRLIEQAEQELFKLS